MYSKGMTWLGAILAVLTAVAPVSAATICGVARNSQGQGTAGIQVLVKDSNGQVLGQATTDKNGDYIVNGVAPGTVNLFLEPGSTAYKNGSGVLTLSEASSQVNWQVSDAAAAAAEQNGICDPAGGWTTPEIASIALIGAAALGSGLALGFATGPDHPSSPQH